ncbi:branched-chain-amino-acid transaminase [Aureliella helgolandensis]|uniref:Branched-chain-amino-acid aminotransferase n=1 Tax=Aureliella helgolandensis TaxID=2527968 RepID=A0A518GC92_9BACT|nr:branched-chain-amino-acid transaminase [Aureliella helgolandensis]QDV26167.1 Branched-chain-amino-acid aminotransferase [Aureliella helgolandensis]
MSEVEVYINGTYFPKSEAKVSVYDHGFLYGDGVFEGMRAYSGNVFRLGIHIDRLFQSARAILLEIPITPAQMIQAVQETLQRNKLSDAYIRLVVSRGAGSLGLDPTKTSDPQVIIIADHIALYPKELYEQGLEIITAATIRNHPAALNPRIKSLNYLNNIMAKIEGKLAGCSEALMLNHLGQVAECTGDNIFIVSRGKLMTPSINAGILEGITRNAVLELAQSAGMEVLETTMSRHDIYIADECFLTGSAAEVIPVIKLDDRPIGDGQVGPVTKQLSKAFHELVRQPG